MNLGKDPYHERLAEILSDIYANPEFIKNMFETLNFKGTNGIRIKFGEIIKYYLMSRDKKKYGDYKTLAKEISRFYEGRPSNIINNRYDPSLQLEWDRKIWDNADEKGFITHSFYGKEGNYIRRYGLNYFKYISEEEKKEYLEAEDALYRLLDFFNGAKYTVKGYRDITFGNRKYVDRNNRLIYFTTPGQTTFLYTLGDCPTLLFETLLRYYDMELGILKDKNKTDRVKEILINRAKNLQHSKSIQIDESTIINDINTVVDYYCSGMPGFVLVRIKDVRQQNIKFGTGDIDEIDNKEYIFDELILQEVQSKKGEQVESYRNNLSIEWDFLSLSPNLPTKSRLEDFYAKASDLDNIPVQCVSCLDLFDIIKLKQQIEQEKKEKNGER